MKQDLNLTVCGQGAVTPMGTGLASLLSNEPWATHSMPSLKDPQKNWPAFRVNLQTEDLKRWLREPRLRRASPISIFMAEAASQALTNIKDPPREKMGIIAAFFTGSIAYSQRFFREIVQTGQKFASPALFPETVFNSPLSHTASIFQISGKSYALVGDDSAWVTAIQVAGTWLRQKELEYVLVIGAEELDSSSLEAYAASRWLRPPNPFIPSEGAGAVLLKLAQPGNTRIIRSAIGGLSYRTRMEASQMTTSCFEAYPSKLPVYMGTHHHWLVPVADQICAAQKRQKVDHSFPYCGEGFTASASWNTLRALSCLDSGAPHLLQPVLGLNQQISALELSGRMLTGGMREIDLADLKKLLMENCMLKVAPAEIGEESPLFGPEGLGLDSIDALQITLAVEKTYGVPIKDPATAKQVLQTLGTLRDWLRRQPIQPNS